MSSCLAEQSPLNLVDANYIFTQIAKLFSLMFLHEQTERSTQNESECDWCDQCSSASICFSHYYLETIHGWLERSV